MLLFDDYIVRIGFAFLMGLAIGVERQYRQRNAGLRTNILVTIGSAAFTVLSCSLTDSTGDPSRVAAQIVSGIGFLGGGLILKDGFNVRGLNTAATIWCSAAVGTICGMGMYAEAGVLVAFVLATHLLLRPLCLYIEKLQTREKDFTIRCECEDQEAEKIQRLIMNALEFDANVTINEIYYKEEADGTVVICNMETLGDHKALLDLIVSRLRHHPGVISAGWKARESPQEDF